VGNGKKRLPWNRFDYQSIETEIRLFSQEIRLSVSKWVQFEKILYPPVGPYICIVNLVSVDFDHYAYPYSSILILHFLSNSTHNDPDFAKREKIQT
jgi:hypothetical protein